MKEIRTSTGLKIDAADSSEMLVPTNQVTCHNPENPKHGLS